MRCNQSFKQYQEYWPYVENTHHARCIRYDSRYDIPLPSANSSFWLHLSLYRYTSGMYVPDAHAMPTPGAL